MATLEPEILADATPGGVHSEAALGDVVAESPQSGVELKSLPLSDLNNACPATPTPTPTAAATDEAAQGQGPGPGQGQQNEEGFPASKGVPPASSPPTKVCQYFVLSPRPSVESPDSRADGDENASHNLRNIQGKPSYLAKTPTKRSARGPGSQGIRTNYRDQPCLRPASAERLGTPSRRTATALSSTTPRRPLTAIHGRDPTPGRACTGVSTQESTDALDHVDACLSVMSSCSHLSQESRLSRLSRKTSTKKHLSSKEMEELAIQQKREQIREMIARNQSSCRKAIASAEFNSGGRAHNSVRHVTVPREFHLSGGMRSARPSRPARDTSADTMSVCSERSVRSNQSATGSVSARPWRPQLTVPEAPPLSVSNRKPRPSQSQPEVGTRPMTPRTGASKPAAAPSKDASTIATASKRAAPTPRASTPQRGTSTAGGAGVGAGPGTARVQPRASMPDRQRLSAKAPTTATKPSSSASSSTATARGTSTRVAAATGPASSAPAKAANNGTKSSTAHASTSTSTSSPTVTRSASGTRRGASATAAPTAARASAVGQSQTKAMERAEQARLLAARKKADQERAAKEKLSVFRRPTATPARSTARTMVTSKATQTVECEDIGEGPTQATSGSNKDIQDINDNISKETSTDGNNGNANSATHSDTIAAAPAGASAVAIEVAQDGAQLMTSPLRPCSS